MEDVDGEIAELSEDLIITWTVVKSIVIPENQPSLFKLEFAPRTPAVSSAATIASTDGFEKLAGGMTMDTCEQEDWFYDGEDDDEDDNEDEDEDYVYEEK